MASWKAVGASGVLAEVDPRGYGAKGDSSQDDLAGLQAAIAAVQARAAALGGGVGAVNLGYGIYKVSASLVIPSNVVLRSGMRYGFSTPMGGGGQIQPLAGFTDPWLIDTAPGTVGAGIEGVRVYINNAFTTTNGVRWRVAGGWIERMLVENCPGIAVQNEGVAGVIRDCVLHGFKSRDGSTVIALADFTGGGLNVTATARDNFYFNNEIDGGSASMTAPYTTLRSPQLYHCSVVAAGGGVDRWMSNIIENGDQGIYVSGSRNQFHANRFEWNAGHGVASSPTNSIDHQFVGNAYNNNGLAQHDRFYDLYSRFGRSSFTGERFSRDTTGSVSTFSTNTVACAVWEGSATGAFINFYSNCVDTGHWASAPFLTLNRAGYDRSDVRAGFQQWSNFAAEPTSGMFTAGETYRIGARTANAHVGRFVRGGGTVGTLTGVTMDTTSGVSTATVNNGTLVPVGSLLAVAGVTWTGAPNTSFARVLHKNGNVVTLDGTASATVAAAACSSTAPTIQDWGALRLVATQVFDPPSLVDATETTTQTMTVTGATLGDIVHMSFNQNTQGVALRGWVSATNTVSYRFRNTTGATVDLASGTVKAEVTT